MGELVNGKAVRIDNTCDELLKFDSTEDFGIPKCLHNIAPTVWRQEALPQKREATISKVLFKNWSPYERSNYRVILLRSHPGDVVVVVAVVDVRSHPDDVVLNIFTK